jgi:hypothetical protein
MTEPITSVHESMRHDTNSKRSLIRLLRSWGIAGAALLAVSALGAQQTPPHGRIEGEIVDSVHARPLDGALVMATRLSPAPAQFFSAVTDSKGRFRFDTLAAGHYSVGFSVSFFDSLDIVLPPHELTLADGEQTHLALMTPSGAALRAAACPGLSLPHGKGAVVGDVTDADNDKPAAGAHVVIQWTELSLDKQTLHAESVPRAGVATTDSLGRYRFCGVPTNDVLVLEVQTDKVAGADVDVVVDDSIGVAKRELSFSAAESRSLADTAAAGDDSALTKPLTGSATLTGTVRSPEGNPVARARVRLVDAAADAVTDSAGHFELSHLPAGTQVAEVRKLGYTLSRAQAELRRGQATALDIRLTRFASLDSVRIMAQRTQYRAFEENRRHGSGTFLTEEQIARKNVSNTSDLMRGARGMRVIGAGTDARVVSVRRAMSTSGGSCAVNVVIDGMQHMDINMIEPAEIGAMEIYAGASTVPIEYASGSPCGAIVVWTKQ